VRLRAISRMGRAAKLSYVKRELFGHSTDIAPNLIIP
jgi:hypothetical protein